MATPFTVVIPTPVTDLNFISSSVPETDYPVYNPVTHYLVGDRVILTTGYHRVYESLQTPNHGNFPATSPLFWIEIAPTNRWAAFDESGGTLTTGTAPLSFTVMGSQLTSIGLLEVDAPQVRIQAFNAIEGFYYDQTFDLPDSSVVSSWYDYFFSAIRRSKELVVTDIPPISDSEYTVTLLGTGTVSIGTFVIGTATELGMTQYNPKIGIIDYSRKEVDEFGRATLVRRAFSKRMDAQLYVRAGVVDSVARILSELRATNALWIGSKDSYNSLTIYGFYRDFSIDISYPSYSICSLQIEGLGQ